VLLLPLLLLLLLLLPSQHVTRVFAGCFEWRAALTFSLLLLLLLSRLLSLLINSRYVTVGKVAGCHPLDI
jgi:hypothetical protein